MSTIFTKIIEGTIPCYKIAEDAQFFAFLDIAPLTKGHVLVVPKLEEDYLFDIPDESLGQMMVFSKKVAKAIEKVIPCKRVGVAVIGLEVPHAHIHLVPINGINDLDFSNPKLSLQPDEFKEIAQKINAAF